MHGNPDGRDSFYTTSTNSYNGHNQKGFDDDGDGLVDEDYGAVSDHDAYVSYSDFYGDPNPILQHVPLGLRMWQKSYAWHTGSSADAIIILDYTMINTNQSRVWNDVYVGMFADADVGPVSVPGYYGHNYSAYDSTAHMAYVDNPVDKPSTPFGISLLGTPSPFDSLRTTFFWGPGQQVPSGDLARYDLMSSGIIKPKEFPSLSDTRFWHSVGPFQVAAQETLHVVYALVSGANVADMLNNGRRAERIYQSNGFIMPVAHVNDGGDGSTLKISWDPLNRSP